jgi:hypothetical protein
MWKCNKCGQETDRLIICWGESGGQKVDVIDYFCPNPDCGHTELTFQGTQKELDTWWDKE